MKLFTLDATSGFSCLAGACPDTCCKGWEIILDEDALARYQTLPGALGEAVRQALVPTPEGEVMFRLENGHCALLREDGLCPIQCAYGEQALCKTCRAHPRFLEEYGATAELTLALSCPAAARLLLQREEPLRLLEGTLDAPVTPNELDAALYFALRRLRETLMALAQERTLALPERLGLILHLAERAQPLLDSGTCSAVEPLCERFEDASRRARPLAWVRRRMHRHGTFAPCWIVLRNMEHLTEEFPKRLDRVFGAAKSARGCAAQFENLLVYFLFRYVLKAVADGALLPRVESCIFHLLAIRYLAVADGADSPESLQPIVSLYCKEVEHSEENLRLLQRLFGRGTLNARYLYSVLAL